MQKWTRGKQSLSFLSILTFLAGLPTTPGNAYVYNRSKSQETEILTEAHIVGGYYATPGEFPYQVALVLSKNNDLFCGGSIMDPHLILTAAHCLQGFYSIPNNIKVIAGTYNLRSLNNAQVRNVRRIYTHENYNEIGFANDIALILLETPLEYTSYVRNIGLPDTNELFFGMVTVTGWGRTENNVTSTILKKVTMPIFPNQYCNDVWPNLITDSQLCTREEGLAHCYGDSGGPGTCTRIHRRSPSIVLYGVVSFGNQCEVGKFPSVYTRVSSYIDWIENTGRILMDDIGGAVCNAIEFQCANGECILSVFRCNQDNDCGDDSDEVGCPTTTTSTTSRTTTGLPWPCPGDWFRCANGSCIPSFNRCNYNNDCGDNSDEVGCHITSTTTTTPLWSCSGDQFHCDNGIICIPSINRCDGYNDCGDYSDEVGCPTTTTTTTISPTPEFRWSCLIGQFRCDNWNCIPLNYRCDMKNDCLDNSDEVDCYKTPTITTGPQRSCSDYQFQCDHDICIPTSFRCDGNNDCMDGSDEANCPTFSFTTPRQSFCSKIRFRCDNGQCITSHLRCYGDNDCSDGSDERNCNVIHYKISSLLQLQFMSA